MIPLSCILFSLCVYFIMISSAPQGGSRRKFSTLLSWLLFTEWGSASWVSVLCSAVWTGADSKAVLSVTDEQTCPNGTDKTTLLSDTLHTSAEHRDPGRRPHPHPVKSNFLFGLQRFIMGYGEELIPDETNTDYR